MSSRSRDFSSRAAVRAFDSRAFSRRSSFFLIGTSWGLGRLSQEGRKGGEGGTHASFILSFFILMRYCVILVILCLHLCTKNSGQ